MFAESRRKVSGQDLDAAGASDRAAATAGYIADLTEQMSQMSRQAGLEVLTYLLDIAHLEARRAEAGGLPATRAHDGGG